MNSNEDTKMEEDDFQIGIRIDDGIDMEDPETADRPDAPGLTENDRFGESMLSEIQALKGLFDHLSVEFESKLKYDEHKNKVIDDLHQELQLFREGMIKKHIHSIVMDIIKIVDDIRKFKTHHEQEPHTEKTAASLLDFMDQIASDLEDLFSWQGIVPFTCDQNTFDTTRQRIIKKIETDNPEKDKRVAQSLRPGYEWDGRVLRPEMVSVYVYNGATHEKDSLTDG